MANAFLYDKTYHLLSKSLDVSAKRNSLLSGNIANVDTVSYKTKDLDFQKTLQKEMEEKPKPDFLFSTNQKHFKLGVENKPLFSYVKSADVLEAEELTKEGMMKNPDPVDIDKQMSSIVENNVKYRSSIEMMLRKIGILRQAISEGGR